MRFALALTTMALSSGCIEKTDATHEPHLIAQERVSDPTAPHRNFLKKLDTSPSFKSPIRSFLVKNPSKYQVSTWPIVDSFHGLSEEFRCPVSKRFVESALRLGWELVRCEVSGPVFFRRVREDDSCGSPRLLHYFEVLQVSWERGERFGSNIPSGKKPNVTFLMDLPRLELEVAGDIKAKLVKPYQAENLDVSRSSIGDRNLYRIIDSAQEVGVLLRVRDDGSRCANESSGLIIGKDIVGRVSSPVSNYAHIRKLLAEALDVGSPA